MACFNIFQDECEKWGFELLDKEGNGFLYSVKKYDNEKDVFIDVRGIIDMSHISSVYTIEESENGFIFFVGKDNNKLGKSKIYSQYPYCVQAKEIVCNLCSQAVIHNLKELHKYLKAKEEGRIGYIEVE